MDESGTDRGGMLRGRMIASRGRGIKIPALILSLCLNLGIAAWAGSRLDQKPPPLIKMEVELALLPAPAPQAPPAPVPQEEPAPPKPRPKPEPRKKHRPEPKPALEAKNENPPADVEPEPAGGHDLEESSPAPDGEADESALSPGPSPGPSPSRLDLPASYQRHVFQKLERAKRYPLESRMNREEGTVKVKFVIYSSGSIGSIEVIRSSGHPLLDQAAVDAVLRAAPFDPLPPGFDRLPLSVPIRFTLR